MEDDYLGSFGNDNMFSWVYIIEEGAERSFSINYSLNLAKDIAFITSDACLVFYRRFDNILDGLAYKLFMENLSLNSMMRIISQTNPHYQDLRESFFNTNL